MMRMWSFVALSGLVFAIAAPASAQQAPPAPPVGIYLAAEGGAVIQPQTAAFGVEFGERVHPNVVTYATLSYLENVMNGSLTDQLADLSQELTARTGRTWNISGRDRAVSFVAGAKYMAATGRVRPYVGAGAGAVAIRRVISDRLAGDVTAATFNEFGIGDASLTTSSLTRPLAEATLGVDLEFNRTHVEIGYRYRRAFHIAQRPDLAQLSVGIGINF